MGLQEGEGVRSAEGGVILEGRLWVGRIVMIMAIVVTTSPPHFKMCASPLDSQCTLRLLCRKKQGPQV